MEGSVDHVQLEKKVREKLRSSVVCCLHLLRLPYRWRFLHRQRKVRGHAWFVLGEVMPIDLDQFGRLRKQRDRDLE